MCLDFLAILLVLNPLLKQGLLVLQRYGTRTQVRSGVWGVFHLILGIRIDSIQSIRSLYSDRISFHIYIMLLFGNFHLGRETSQLRNLIPKTTQIKHSPHRRSLRLPAHSCCMCGHSAGSKLAMRRASRA